MDYSPEQLLEFWKKGKPLYKALWQFCDDKYKQQYPKGYLSPDIPTVSLISYAVDQLGKLSRHENQKKDALEKLKKNLCEKLNKEQLIAIGHLKSSNSLAIIPIYLCEPNNLDLNKSSISGNGIDYSSVRIIRKSTFKKTPIKKQNPLPKYKIEKKPQGRPSIGNIIIEAYHMLDKDGQIDIIKPLNSHYEAIRSVVRESYPDLKDNKGMEDEAIRKRIAVFFNAKKQSHKVSHKL